nr:hypothetical protein [Tanacetum cinerariifolium]
MSEASSTVTYTSVYTNSEPGRVFWGSSEELSDEGSPRVIVYGYDGLPMLPPHDPDFMPEPIYPEYIPLEDEHILSAEEQPLPPVILPTAESPGYVTKSDQEEDPEEYEEDEAEDGPDEDDEEEEEEHLSPADSAVVISINELVSPPEETEPTIPPPSTDTTTIGARITIRPQTSISLSLEAEVERLLAMPTPPPLPLTSLSPPSAGERLARCKAPAALPSPLLTPFSYPPPPVDRRDVMSSDSRVTITYTLMSSYEVIVNEYFGMPMDPLDPYVQLIMEAPPSPDYTPGPEAPPSPDYIPGPKAPPSPDYIPGPKYLEYLPPAEEKPLPAAVSPTAESLGYITKSEPEMEPEEDDGDDENSKRDSIEYPTSRGYDDADDDGNDLSEDDADDEDEEESSKSEEEEEEHLALTIPTPALHSSIPASEDSDETKPFEEGETAATPPSSGYRVAARISVQPHILMPFRSESEVERLLAIHTPPLSPVSPTSYLLPPFLMPLPIFTPLPTSSFPLHLSLPSTSGSKSISEADIPLQKRARFTTPTCGYEIGESSVAAAAGHIRPALTIADSRRAEDRLIGRLRR